jgi:hypothetical protein
VKVDPDSLAQETLKQVPAMESILLTGSTNTEPGAVATGYSYDKLVSGGTGPGRYRSPGSVFV